MAGSVSLDCLSDNILGQALKITAARVQPPDQLSETVRAASKGKGHPGKEGIRERAWEGPGRQEG